MPPELPTPALPARPGTLALVVGCAFAAMYLAFPTADHSYDAVAYAMDVEHAFLTGTSVRLWHPYHILYGPAGYVLHRLARHAGFHPLMTLQMFNAVSGGLLAGLLLMFLHRRTGDGVLSLAGVLLLGFSGASWYYGSDAEPYVPSALMILVFLELVPVAGRRRRPALVSVLSGAALGLAAGLHLSALVLVPAAIPFVFLEGRDPLRPDGAAAGGPSNRRGIARAALFTAAALIVTAAPYAAKWTLVEKTGPWRGAAHLARGIFVADEPNANRSFLVQPYNPAVEAAALVCSFAPGGRSDGPHPPCHPVLWILPVGLMVLAAAGFARAVAGRRRETAFHFVALSTMLLFFTSYNLGSMKFTVSQSLVLVTAAILSAGDLLRDHPRARRVAWIGPVAAGCLAVSTARCFIVPGLDESANPSLVKAMAVKEATRPEDAVMLIGLGRELELKVYLPYFAAREVLILDFFFNPGTLPAPQAVARVRARADRVLARGGTVYVLDEIAGGGPDMDRFYARQHVAAPDLVPLFRGLSLGRPVTLRGGLVLRPLRGGTRRGSRRPPGG